MNTEEKFTVPSTQFVENPEGYVLKASLPGIAKEDTELHVEGKTLVLKAHSRYQNPAGFRQVEAEFGRENYAASVDLPEMAEDEYVVVYDCAEKKAEYYRIMFDEIL